MKTSIKFVMVLACMAVISCTQDSLGNVEDFSEEVELNLSVSSGSAALLDTRNYSINRAQVDVLDLINGAQVVGSATLYRRSNDISTRFQTSDLIPGHAYTLWWVIWNKPENCATPGACIDTDFAIADQVEVEVMYAAGRVVGADGKAVFTSRLKQGDTSDSSNDFFGLPSFGGLQDTQTAEVHLVVRSHGPIIPGQVHEQIGSYEGGCNVFFPPFTEVPDEEGECGDIHAAIFAPLII